ncbi:MAG: VanZ family protein [Myxococcales bacterium]|nr:VanZ family protein [Myxococcales bacterium]
MLRSTGLALMAVTLAITLIATLAPFRFQLSTASWARIDWRVYYPRHNDRDLVLNLIMLVPLGAGVALARFGRASLARIVLEAGALGLGMALVIETLQIFERARFPQIADVWRNGVGCAVGAFATAALLTMMARTRQR